MMLIEWVFFYIDWIHVIYDVCGKDGVGVKMDFMELECERGIMIVSVVMYCEWLEYYINIIDMFGYVDFIIEVECVLCVLDGVVLVLCLVVGVQS